ncbi:putative zinc finger protein [Orchesella cincta]|uniref:Putative zinc finger protein n=1 Tax=Orchesella cincta TaxID=48709 RepID=A0A1D2MAC5_ORCCI|nr:putative zinc finger protein [Orchesella cincta]
MVHTEKNKERQQCPKCPLSFGDMRKFWQHVVLVHETQGDEDGGTSSNEENPRLDPRVNTMWITAEDGEPTCKECNKKFANVKGVKKHIKDIHLKLTFRECLRCGQKFRDTHNLNRHMKDVHSLSATDFPCSLCSIVYCSADGLFRHKRTVHGIRDLPATSGTPPTQCPYCSEIFYHQGFETHIRELHSEHYEEYLTSVMKKPQGTGRQPSTCQTCGLSFSDVQTLRRHITRVHDPSGKFQCSECGKHFGDQKELTTHLAMHQNAVMEPHIKAMLRSVFGTVCSPSMTCGICQTVVDSSVEAKLHLYVNHPDKFKEMIPSTPSGTGFVCTVCSVQQNTKEEMIQHMELYHQEENLPTCGICGHKELKERDMNYHYKRYHSEATRYVCDVCQESFTQKRELEKHVKREHTDEAGQCPYCPEKHIKVKMHVTKMHPERAVEYRKLVDQAIKEEREARKRFNQFLEGKNIRNRKRRVIDGDDSDSDSDKDEELSDDNNDGWNGEEGELEKKPIPSDCVVQQTKPVTLEKYKIEKKPEQPHVIEIQRIVPPAPDPEQILPDDCDGEDEQDIKPNVHALNEEQLQLQGEDEDEQIQEDAENEAEQIQEDEEEVELDEEEPRYLNLVLYRKTLAVEVERLNESEIKKWTSSASSSTTAKRKSPGNNQNAGPKTKKRRKRRY